MEEYQEERNSGAPSAFSDGGEAGGGRPDTGEATELWQQRIEAQRSQRAYKKKMKAFAGARRAGKSVRSPSPGFVLMNFAAAAIGSIAQTLAEFEAANPEYQSTTSA